jgi:RecA/RadA recombinase
MENLKTSTLDESTTALDIAIKAVIVETFKDTKDYDPVVYHPVPQNEREPVLYRNTINTIFGVAGVRKTTFAMALAAQASKTKRVLWVDTEQSDQDLKRLERSLERYNPVRRNFFFAAFMHPYEGVTPIELLEGLVRNLNPDLIVIDNVTDFDTECIMEYAPAKKLTDQLLKLTLKNELCILGIIHANEVKGTGYKPRGHVGSEFLRKSHVVFRLESDESSKSKIFVKIDKFRSAIGVNFEFTADRTNHPTFSATINIENESKKMQPIKKNKI